MRVPPTVEIPCKICPERKAKGIYQLVQATLYRCPHCDLHFIDYLDPPSKDEGLEHSLSAHARQYIARRQDEGLLLHSLRLALLARHTSLTNAQLLDIGAGLGHFQRLVTKETTSEIYGIEPSPLRRQYAQEQSGINLYREYVDDPYWQTNFPEHFDAITLWDVLEHVNAPMTTLKSIVSLLKPGGIVAIDTPNREVKSYRLSEICYSLTKGRCTLFLENFYSTLPYGHKQIFTTKQLYTLINQLGLNIRECRHSYPNTTIRNSKIILIAQKP